MTQMRELQAQNKKLLEDAARKDAQIAELSETAEAATALASQDVAAAKIAELAKKNRQLGLQLERERSNILKLEAQIAAGAAATNIADKMKEALDASSVEEAARDIVEQASKQAEQATREAAAWKQKYDQLVNRQSKQQQQVAVLEQQKAKYERALKEETGEDDVQKIFLEKSRWRGRASEIELLKQKLKDARVAAGKAQESKPDLVAKQAVSDQAALGAQRRKKVEAASDVDELNSKYAAMKLKYDGAQSRMKILEKDAASMKTKIQVVLDKTRNDDVLIGRLREEISSLKRSGAAGGARGGAPGDGPRVMRVNKEDQAELLGMRRRCAEQEEAIERQQQIIMGLQGKLNEAAAHPTYRDEPKLVKELEAENMRLKQLAEMYRRQLNDPAPAIPRRPTLDGE